MSEVIAYSAASRIIFGIGNTSAEALQCAATCMDAGEMTDLETVEASPNLSSMVESGWMADSTEWGIDAHGVARTEKGRFAVLGGEAGYETAKLKGWVNGGMDMGRWTKDDSDAFRACIEDCLVLNCADEHIDQALAAEISISEVDYSERMDAYARKVADQLLEMNFDDLNRAFGWEGGDVEELLATLSVSGDTYDTIKELLPAEDFSDDHDEVERRFEGIVRAEISDDVLREDMAPAA